MRRELTLALLLLPIVSFAQSKVHLEFESPGVRKVWIADTLAPPTKTAQTFDGKSADIDSAQTAPESYVLALDTVTGNLAAKQVKEVANGWLVKNADFSRIGTVLVRVEHGGAPISGATITLKDSKRTIQQTIDPSVKGEVLFFGLTPGTLKIEVAYRSGTLSKTQKQGFDVDLKRDASQPTLVVSIPDDVVTLQPANAAPTTTTSNQGPPAEAVKPDQPVRGGFGWLGQLVIYLLALAFAGGVVYFGLKWVKDNPTKAGQVFQSLGAPLPDPNKDDTAVAAVVLTPAPQPQQQIILGGADPNVPAAPTVATHISLSPKLVRDTGEVLDVPDGTSAVGRDPGLGLSLVGENSVSRKHAEIVRHGNEVRVRDLGSTNGTFVNGARLNGEADLRIGDSVQFGSVKFRYEG